MREPYMRLVHVVTLVFLCLLTAPAWADDGDDGLLDDILPPYEGPGHVGEPVEPGDDGTILGFPAEGVTLLSWITVLELDPNSANANDCFGYVSPSGREYAIVGLSDSTAFVEITDPVNPVIVEIIPDGPSLWSDPKVYGHYCLNVNEDDSGTATALQVIDLDDIDNGNVTLVGNFFLEFGGQQLRRSHNLTVNAASGFAYLSGPNIFGGRLVAVDLADPENPQIAGVMEEATYVHDAWVHTYTEGPYAGREIAFCASGYSGLRIVDVTDKSDMYTVSSLVYDGLGYCHHSWLREDEYYLFINDELDEYFGYVSTTTTYVVDVHDIDNPSMPTAFTNGSAAIDHNPLGRCDFLFEANYRSGVRIYDISDIGNVQEAGYFDTFPANDNPNFNAVWGVNPWLPSGVVIASDIEQGLFVFDAGDATSNPANPRGDINHDGVVDGDDTALFVSAVMGLLTEHEDVHRADMNCDGKADVEDVQKYVDVLLGV